MATFLTLDELAATIGDGMSLAEIAVVLGHKSTQTTAKYAHASDEVSRNIARRMGELGAKTPW